MKDKRTKARLLEEIESLTTDLKHARDESDKLFREKLELHKALQHSQRITETERAKAARLGTWAAIARRRADYNGGQLNLKHETVLSLLGLLPCNAAICPSCGKATAVEDNKVLEDQGERDEREYYEMLCSDCHEDVPFSTATYRLKGPDGSEVEYTSHMNFAIASPPEEDKR